MLPTVPKLPPDIEPQNSMLVVIPDELPESVGGIYIPATQRSQRPESGVLVGLSKAIENAGYYNLGDRLLFGQYAGVVVRVDGVVYQFLDSSEVLAMLPAGANVDPDPPGVDR